MKTYRESMNELRFSPQQKQEMIDQLMNQSARQPRGRAIPLRRICALGAAAALAGALCLGAAASGALKPAAQAFGAVFGTAPAQTEIIDRIGRPLDARATVDGVTVQADAIIGDTYSYAIVYSIYREDGQPITADPDPNRDGALALRFGDWDTDVGHMGGMHGTAWFFDEDPADNAVQFVQLLTADAPLEPGTATVRLTDLKQGIGEDAALLAEGSWELRFDFAFEDSSLELPGGQSFTVNGASAVLNSVAVSPLSLRIDYTVETGLSSSSGTADSTPTPQPVFLTLTDGSRIDLTGFGGGVRPEGDSLRCELSGVFDQIFPLDTIESITIGEVTLPVNSQ
ncbi:hypothetical protein [Allofournierella massiliensis]|uniref:DUF4179 domain-containing protein n=1 Tax=Allofournierella massiliensis TaxID=1650663 RepID=A0ABT7URX6_9FIRM|nr:hypothetical protein [Fournierella massiliensis]MDM8201083.1 hypothetical protein [Fournierella massiliensis]